VKHVSAILDCTPQVSRQEDMSAVVPIVVIHTTGIGKGTCPAVYFCMQYDRKNVTKSLAMLRVQHEGALRVPVVIM
jgi:hypothetical protein